MDAAGHVAALRVDGEALAGAAEGALDRPVPTCPDWDVAALVGHTGGVHRWVSELLASSGDAPKGRPAPPEQRGELLAWYREGLGALAERLSDGDPDAECWTWRGPRTRWWWCRRMSAETAVHRVDAEMARMEAPVGAVDAGVAVDGVEEFLSELLPGLVRREGVARPSGTLHVHATDAPGEWWLDFDAPDLTLRRVHAKAGAAVRGPASQLLLWLWRRIPAATAGLEMFGPSDTFDRLTSCGI